MSNKLISLAQLDRFYLDLRASGINPVVTKTEKEWKTYGPKFVPAKGQIVVYSDHKTDTSGKPIPGIKIGTGSTYACDLPFITLPEAEFDKFEEHMNNMAIHVSIEDRSDWNNKVSCDYTEETETLKFT